MCNTLTQLCKFQSLFNGIQLLFVCLINECCTRDDDDVFNESTCKFDLSNFEKYNFYSSSRVSGSVQLWCVYVFNAMILKKCKVYVCYISSTP